MKKKSGIKLVINDYHQTKRVYNTEGNAPSLPAKAKGNTGTNTPMILDSSTSSEESEDSDLDLKGRIEIVHKHKTGNVPQGYSQTGTVVGTRGISPAVRKEGTQRLIMETHQNKPIIIENFYKGRKQREYKDEAPALRKGRQGLLDRKSVV